MEPAKGENFFGIGGDEEIVQLGTGACGLDDPLEHRAAREGEEHFAGKARAGETGGNDAECAEHGFQ